MPEKEL